MHRVFSATVAALCLPLLMAADLGGSGFGVRDLGPGPNQFFKTTDNTGAGGVPPDPVAWPATPYVFLHASDPAGSGSPFSDETGFADGTAIDGTPYWESSGSDAAGFYSLTGGTNDPTWEDDASNLNGEPYVDFGTGNPGRSENASSTFNFIHNGSDFTIATVVKIVPSGTNGVFLSTASIAGDATGFWLRHDDVGDTDKVKFEIPTASATYAVQLVSANSALVHDTWALLIVRFESGKTGNDYELYNWSTLLDSDEAQTTHDTGNPTHALRLGGSNVWQENVRMTFLGIWQRALTDDELGDIRTMVTNRWGDLS